VGGLINGPAVARLKLSPFIVTLGKLSVARSQALIISNNKMIYQFGPDQKPFVTIGGGSLLGIPSACAQRISGRSTNRLASRSQSARWH
jgi:ribose transport system permease protein